jgi:uncharacterized protein
MAAQQTPLVIALPDGATVDGLLAVPRDPRACLVLAHGAGAGMHHAFLADVAVGLAERDVATLRFQFPFMQQGARRPDTPAVAHAAVRAAVHEAARRLPQVPLFAGGKSFGGRMTSQAQAIEPLPHVRGIVFLGFPMHPAGKPASERAAHLAQVGVPMLFLQGTRDALAELALVRAAAGQLGARASLHVVDGADHAFHMLARSGRDDRQVRDELLATIDGWIGGVVKGNSHSVLRTRPAGRAPA